MHPTYSPRDRNTFKNIARNMCVLHFLATKSIISLLARPWRYYGGARFTFRRLSLLLCTPAHFWLWFRLLLKYQYLFLPTIASRHYVIVVSHAVHVSYGGHVHTLSIYHPISACAFYAPSTQVTPQCIDMGGVYAAVRRGGGAVGRYVAMHYTLTPN